MDRVGDTATALATLTQVQLRSQVATRVTQAARNVESQQAQLLNDLIASVAESTADVDLYA